MAQRRKGLPARTERVERQGKYEERRIIYGRKIVYDR